MTKTQRNLLTFSAVGALFLAGSFLQSRGSRADGATYATPVQVMNTSSAPVIGVDAEKLARIPYQETIGTTSSTQGTSPGDYFCPNTNSCQMYFIPPPTGYRLVIQHVSAFYWENSGTSQPPLFYLDLGLNEVFALPATFVQSYDPPIVMAVMNQDVLAYVDAGTGMTGISAGSFPGAGFPETVTLTGYLENCSITGCPAIKP